MKILITGGAGFIGGNLVRHMLNEHPTYQIVNLDVQINPANQVAV